MWKRLPPSPPTNWLAIGSITQHWEAVLLQSRHRRIALEAACRRPRHGAYSSSPNRAFARRRRDQRWIPRVSWRTRCAQICAKYKKRCVEFGAQAEQDKQSHQCTPCSYDEHARRALCLSPQSTNAAVGRRCFQAPAPETRGCPQQEHALQSLQVAARTQVFHPTSALCTHLPLSLERLLGPRIRAILTRVSTCPFPQGGAADTYQLYPRNRQTAQSQRLQRLTHSIRTPKAYDKESIAGCCARCEQATSATSARPLTDLDTSGSCRRC